MRFRVWFILGAMLLVLQFGSTGERSHDRAGAVDLDASATPAIDYGATLTVLAQGRTPDPAVQQTWETYFNEIGTEASSDEEWPAILTFESVDVDYEIDRETRELEQVSGEYELEFPGNDRYASVVVAMQPSEADAQQTIDDLTTETDGGSWEVGIAPEIGDGAVCLLLSQDTVAETICTARLEDTLVTTLWSSDVESSKAAQENAALLARLFVEAMEAVVRPEL